MTALQPVVLHSEQGERFAFIPLNRSIRSRLLTRKVILSVVLNIIYEKKAFWKEERSGYRLPVLMTQGIFAV